MRREITEKVADALRAAGFSVGEVVLRELAEDSDLSRLENDYYLAVGFDDFERVNLVHVELKMDMYAGGDPTIEHWTMPPMTAEAIAAICAVELGP